MISYRQADLRDRIPAVKFRIGDRVKPTQTYIQKLIDDRSADMTNVQGTVRNYDKNDTNEYIWVQWDGDTTTDFIEKSRIEKLQK